MIGIVDCPQILVRRYEEFNPALSKYLINDTISRPCYFHFSHYSLTSIQLENRIKETKIYNNSNHEIRKGRGGKQNILKMLRILIFFK